MIGLDDNPVELGLPKEKEETAEERAARLKKEAYDRTEANWARRLAYRCPAYQQMKGMLPSAAPAPVDMSGFFELADKLYRN